MAKPIPNEAQAKQNLVEPSIECNVKYELGEELLKELRSNSFSGRLEEDVIGQIAKILEILGLIKVAGMNPFQLSMMTFLPSLSGEARKWLKSEGDGKINTWEELIEVGNNEGTIYEDVSNDDDRDHTNSSMITKPELKIDDEFLKILHDNSFNGGDESYVATHIAKVLEIT
nr:hypothetical protein [Tanacetum cinerariifolium]